MSNDKADFLLPPAEHEKFEQFLFEMDDVLNRFLTDAAASGYKLDYSLTSLDELERMLLTVMSSDDSSLQNRAARYLGEVFRRELGGKWSLCDKGPRYLYQGLPVITGYSEKSIEFCPIDTVGDFVRGRKLGLFRRVIENDRPFCSTPKSSN